MEFDGYRLKIEKHQKGDITEYKIMQPGVVSLERDSPDDYAIITRVFSDEYGLNMKYWKVASGSGQILQEFSWEYELVNGVYLPKKVVEKHYGANGDVTREKNSTYINNEVNNEIPAKTFEYTNLHLKDGDIFEDKIANKKYRYKEATKNLEPLSE